jgi:hypothetical protein
VLSGRHPKRPHTRRTRFRPPKAAERTAWTLASRSGDSEGRSRMLARAEPQKVGASARFDAPLLRRT